MAKLAVSAHLLLDALFGDSVGSEGLAIVGAEFDAANEIVSLNIVGPEIPEAGNVRAILTAYRQTVKFEAVP